MINRKNLRFYLTAIFIISFILSNCSDSTKQKDDDIYDIFGQPNAYQWRTDLYVINGCVHRDGQPVMGFNLTLFIRDSKYDISQTTFQVQSTSNGFYEFKVTYLPWNGYEYILSAGSTISFTGKIKFGWVENVYFNLNNDTIEVSEGY